MARMNHERRNRQQKVARSAAQQREDRFSRPKRSRVRATKGKVMSSLYTGWCAECGYSVWKGDKIRYNGKAVHFDCVAALNDKTARIHKEDWKNGNN